MKYIDFHTHILPEIDDGATSVSESLEMLKLAKSSGAETVILTPHFLADTTIDEFCQKRSDKLLALQNEIEKDKSDFPNLLCGAEVYLNSALSEVPDLKKLCISGTNLLLLELPFSTWNMWHFNEVYNIAQKHDVVPIMAHIERYLSSPKDIQRIEPLISMGAKFQVNVDSFETLHGKRVIRELADKGLMCALASDCHDLVNRSPDISHTLSVMSKKLGQPFLDYIYETSSELLYDFK